MPPQIRQSLVAGLLACTMLLSGCLGQTNASALDPDDCRPRTSDWQPECARLFLADYYLHAEDLHFELDEANHLTFSTRLVAWHVEVTLTNIQGYAGHNRATNSTMVITSQPAAKIPAGGQVVIAGVSAQPITENTTTVFYGLRIAYNDTNHPGYPHELTLFNRCYGVQGGRLVTLESVSGTAGATLSCKSDKYLTYGEVPEVAVIVHDFQASQHAFPAAEDLEFWDSVAPAATK